MDKIESGNKSSSQGNLVGKLKAKISTMILEFATPIAIGLFVRNDFLKGLEREEGMRKLDELSKKNKREMFFIEVEKATNLDFANSYKENLPKKSEFDSMVELKLESKNWKDHFVWWSLVIIETEKQLNYKLSNYPEWFVK